MYFAILTRKVLKDGLASECVRQYTGFASDLEQGLVNINRNGCASSSEVDSGQNGGYGQG